VADLGLIYGKWKYFQGVLKVNENKEPRSGCDPNKASRQYQKEIIIK